jgi:cytochrome P450
VAATLRKPSVLFEFRADPVGFLRAAAQSGGNKASFQIGRRLLTLITDADSIEQILVKKQHSFRKGPGLLRLRPVLGEGLLTADFPRHAAARRQLQPAFSVPKIDEYGQDIPGIVEQILGDWQTGETRNILTEMSRLTLSVVAATLFRSTHCPDHAAVGESIAENLDALFRPLSRCAHKGGVKTTASTKTLDNVLANVVAGHARSDDGYDLLSLLDDAPFSDSQKRDEALTFLLGGHESVSISLAWTWYALWLNPAVREKFEAEIDKVDPVNMTPQLLPYTRQIVAESLRLYPPAWMFSREVVDDVEVGGNDYVAGSVLVVAPIVTHVAPAYWERAELFDPDRWDMSKQFNSNRPRYCYFPFGGGARRCIGEQFALTELVLALATIGRQWRLSAPVGASTPTFDPVVTLRPLGGLPMVLSRR